MQTGERQAARIRVLYLKAMLKQDISYFDEDARTGEVVNSLSSDTLLIQDAISEKVLVTLSDHIYIHTVLTVEEFGSLEIYHMNTYSMAHMIIVCEPCMQMGLVLHYVSAFVAGFVVGYSMVWKLALVTLAVIPAIAIASGFYAHALTGFASKNREAYEEAGNIAKQVQISTSPPIENLHAANE
jgi:ATP-binding cassette subfamily B (MDR/TAP) protein 1